MISNEGMKSWLCHSFGHSCWRRDLFGFLLLLSAIFLSMETVTNWEEIPVLLQIHLPHIGLLREREEGEGVREIRKE